MGDKKTYIELNGIRYDAHSGKVLEHPLEMPVDAVKSAANKPMTVTSNGAIDGFSRRSHRQTPNKPLNNMPVPAPPRPPVAGRTSKPLRAQPQKSKTLMRPAVKKPQITKLELNTKKSKEKQKTLISTDHAERLERAKHTKKSTIISRFYGGGATPKLTKRADTVPVATAPNATTQAHSAKANAISAAAKPGEQMSNRFEQAIQNATSHLNVHHAKRKKPNRLTIISSALSLALLLGFFAYQNVPQVQMRVAATKAGFSASLPGYSPAGFGVAGPIKSEAGKVSVTFKSRTDDKSFQVKQQVSEWSSTALLANYVKDKEGHITYPDERGRTLYIYGDSNVTWVDGGVWYLIEGNASLTTDQLQRIANSL